MHKHPRIGHSPRPQAVKGQNVTQEHTTHVSVASTTIQSRDNSTPNRFDAQDMQAIAQMVTAAVQNAGAPPDAEARYEAAISRWESKIRQLDQSSQLYVRRDDGNLHLSSGPEWAHAVQRGDGSAAIVQYLPNTEMRHAEGGGSYDNSNDRLFGGHDYQRNSDSNYEEQTVRAAYTTSLVYGWPDLALVDAGRGINSAQPLSPNGGTVTVSHQDFNSYSRSTSYDHDGFFNQSHEGKGTSGWSRNG
jgi:hypothetical protein